MILALETSSPRGSLALFHPATEELVFEERFTSDRAHNAVLFEPLRRALDALEDTQLGLTVIGTGPGSYGGVRVGIAVISSLSLARDCPAIGLPSITTLAADALVVGDARRQSYFTCEIRDHRIHEPPALLDEPAFREAVAASTLPVLTTDAQAPLGLKGIRRVSPEATTLARLAANLPAEEVSRLSQIPLEPLYLRAPYITTPKD